MSTAPWSQAQLALGRALEPARRRYDALQPRERRAVTGMIWVLALGLLWLLAVQPAWRTLRQAPAELARLEEQLQGMQSLATDARTLRALPAVPRAQALVALRAATERLEGASLAEQGDRVLLSLNGVPPQRLREWLLEARTGARARPIEVALTRDANGLSGTVMIAVGAEAAR